MHLVPSYGRELMNVLEVRQSWYEERSGKVSDAYHRKPSKVSLFWGCTLSRACFLAFSRESSFIKVYLASNWCLPMGHCCDKLLLFFILPKMDSQCKRVERVYFNLTQKKKRLAWSAGECQQANVEVTKHQTFRRDLPYLGHQTPCELDFNLFLIEMHWNAWNSSGNPLQNHPKTFSPFVFEAEAFLTERHRTEAPFFSL